MTTFYEAINNNPYRYIDSDGKWWSHVNPIHQKSIDRVLSNLPAEDRLILKEQQVIMDRNQSNEAASKHAMSSPSISKIESWDEANKFVHNELDTARQLRESNHVESLKHLGNAIHTMQDTSSPMHENYQKWDVNESGFDKFEHAIGESIDPGPGSKLDTETRRAWDIYQSPYPVPNEILPKPK